MMPFLWVLIGLALLLVAPPLNAQGLSAAECAEILSKYQLVPDNCASKTQARPASKTAETLTTPTDKMLQNNVFFTAGGSALSSSADQQLQNLAKVLNTPTLANACLRLVGHSDSSGGTQVNDQLSERRAKAVQTKLASMLNNPARVEKVIGLGESAPLNGLSSESRWQRRVTIWVKPCSANS